MDTTEYIVKAYGVEQSRHATEADAIAEAKAEPAEAYATVTMHVRSGTYESHTQVWPTAGETYSD